MRVHTVVALSACFAAAFAAGSATSATARSSEEAASLVLTVSGSASTTEATLSCEPTGGTHVQAAEACRALIGVGGEFGALDVAPDTNCPAIYDPVRATARGVWAGTVVSYDREFGNSCELGARTGPVFAF
ncbi:SSI family serine proteinase inhibitor [Phytomonospora sp. NPDC050363]|uniref:SSI family serine proteinase inhibitor n=1 Tax=Phytomonospora sp. NPDC050363 TaxID=3155642 RepID=UPI0033C227FE